MVLNSEIFLYLQCITKQHMVADVNIVVRMFCHIFAPKGLP